MKAAKAWVHTFSTTSGTNTSFGVFPTGEYETPKQDKKVDVKGAVFSHIRAMRALGHTRVNTDQVAKALSLPPSEVERAIGELSSKGIKVLG